MRSSASRTRRNKMEIIDYEHYHQPAPVVVEQTQSSSKGLVHYIMHQSWVKEQVKNALPSTIPVERILRAAATEIRENPKLSCCDPLSFVGCILTCAQLGLMPGNSLGYVYFSPFYSSDAKKQLCKVIIGYKGLIELAYRSDLVKGIVSRVVREGDYFYQCYGNSEKFEHIPSSDDDRPITHIYAYASLKKGGFISEVISKNQMEALLGENKGKDSWKKYPVAMLRKTAVRRLCNYIPKDPLLELAIQIDDISSKNEEPIEGVIKENGPESVAERLKKKLKEKD